MSATVFLGAQLCLLVPVILGFPVVPPGSARTSDLGPANGDGKLRTVDVQNWIYWSADVETENRSLPEPVLPSSSEHHHQSLRNPIKPIASKSDETRSKSDSIKLGDIHIKLAHITNSDTVTSQKLSHNNAKTSFKVLRTLQGLTKSKTPDGQQPVHQFHQETFNLKTNRHDKSYSENSKPLKEETNSYHKSNENSELPNTESLGYAIPANNMQSLQLAVVPSDHRGQGQAKVSQVVLTVGTSLAALFSLGVVIGIFGCCCKKQEQGDVNENKNENKNGKAAGEKEGGHLDKNPSQIFNPSDLPIGDKDLDETVSVRDKIKALDSKLIIGQSPDHVAKRKSQAGELNYTNNVNQPAILVSDDDVVMRDKSKTKSVADNISKSDTQDDISDKIFDNISTHSSISQPNNPDVVIASDDEDEFSQLQRGTVILKSFQRAKPPRNRSPATRTSKGKIRKPRPNQDRSTDQSTDKSKSREASRDREPANTPDTPSSLSLSPSQGTSGGSKTNSLDKLEKPAKRTSPDKVIDKPVESTSTADAAKKSDSPMTKSTDFSDFDSIMSQSVTSISSDIVSSRKHESPVSARYKKSTDSPKSDRVARTDSPARALKSSSEREVTSTERGDSPSRYKKSKDSPKTKQRHRRRERDRERDFESLTRNGKSEETSESTTENAAETNSAPNRLSGIPANMNNNIFYLIDPTVKNKCKSQGDVAADKRRSGDYGNRKSGDYSSRKSGDFSRAEAKASKHKVGTPDSIDREADGDTSSPAKRERTSPDSNPAARLSMEVQDTPL